MKENKFKALTLWFAILIVLVYLLQVLIPGFTDLFVLNESSINQLQIWRFITSIFLHGSITHLIFNLFALLLFGILLEKLICTGNFLYVFFISGILANIISVNFYPNSLGASGAIMGIIGVLTILRPLMMVWAFGLIVPMFVASILWIIGDILGIFFPSGIGNIAHLSGIAVGIVFGLIFRLRYKRKRGENRSFYYNHKVKIPEDYMGVWEDRFMK